VSTAHAPLTLADLDGLNFSKGGGLLPAVVQHARNGAVLMLGYMNREAVEATLTRGRAVFFSRSKGRLWEKGETSGHTLKVDAICADCDRDALLVSVRPRGPACHLGTATCFGDGPLSSQERLMFLSDLEQVIGERMVVRPEGSYTARLFASGIKRIAQKLGEEGVEVALAGASGTDAEVIGEVSDLFYHVLVLLKARGLSLERVFGELRARHTVRERTSEPLAVAGRANPSTPKQGI
jgi:phosphoribosyl-ATP pyrophosphohydrolase/phosphoribosyl-AMP cyclohydrolase